MKRRDVITGLGGLSLMSLSGCLGAVGMAKHEATPAGAEPSVRNETGYDQLAIDEIGVERTIGNEVYSETVSVKNYLTKHEKSVSLGPLGDQRAAMFMVLTTPKVEIMGENYNPIADRSPTELVELIKTNYDQISNISHESDASVTILDQSTTASQFTADATFNGHDIPVNLHVSEAVEAGEDLVVTIGVYPRQLADREKPNITQLMEGVTTDFDHQDVNNGATNNSSTGS